MSWFRRSPFTALAMASCLSLSALPAVADENRGAPEYAPTMLVLDASGSMAGADPSGGTKMAAAQRATSTLVDAVPDGAPVGLAVYGTNTGSSDAEKQAGCADVTVLRGPEPIDRTALTAAVDGLRPRGHTPIGKALRDAAGALPDSGPRSIVLVSDGIDTCAPPDPCEVTEELEAGGVALLVHTIGFGVDEQARTQLTCIAQSTGGTYTDAPDAGALEQVLPRVTGAALRNYQPAGIPVTGAVTPGNAPELRPGQYLDVLTRDRRKHYAVDVPVGATVYFTATMVYSRVDAPLADVNTLEAQMYAADGTDCGVQDRSVTNFAADGEVVTVSLIWDGAGAQRCTEPGRYIFGVLRDFDQVQPVQLPLEILVGLEPKVTGDQGPPATDEPVPFTAPAGPARPVTGGGSFGTAATLDGSGAYTDTVRLREFVFYRGRVEWGQAIAYRVHYGNSSLDTTVNVDTTLYAPFRTQIDSKSTGYHGEATAMDPVATPPVNYRNREQTGGEDVSVAGWYYLAVKVGRTPLDDHRNDVTVPVRLEVSVTGEPDTGPSYGFASAEASKAGVFGTSGPQLSQAQDEPGADLARNGDTSFPTKWVLAATGVLIVAAVTCTPLATRRRRTG